MIYRFSLDDPIADRFVEAVRSQGLDCEVQTADRVVVRVFGRADAEAEALAGQAAATPAQKPEGGDIWRDFAEAVSPVMIAGPCAVESTAQVAAVVEHLKKRGVRYIRGGAFKPRTSPDAFQGLGEQGLRILAERARPAGLKIVTEVMDRSQIDTVYRHADVLQVGSRSMFNYTLLTALGAVDKPVLLKRGMAATVDEWLQSAEYVSRGGNERIILCERGIRTFETNSRNTLDIAAIARARKRSGYPVIADPSHAAGKSDLVEPLALAAAAAGADGLMVELHPDPQQALSDSDQALDFASFDALLEKLSGMRPALEGTA